MKPVNGFECEECGSVFLVQNDPDAELLARECERQHVEEDPRDRAAFEEFIRTGDPELLAKTLGRVG